MLKKIWEINKREEMKLRANKKALFFLLIVPILYTLLFGFLYSGHVVNDIELVVVNQSAGSLSRDIVRAFDKSERFKIVDQMDDEGQALDLIRSGKAQAALIINKDFDRNIKSGIQEDILFGVNASNSIIGNSGISSANQIVQTFSTGVNLKKIEGSGYLAEEAFAEALAISTSLKPMYNPQYSYQNYLLIGLIVVALQQLLLMSVANSFTREKDEETFDELKDLDANIYELIFGKSLFYFFGGLFSFFATQFLIFKLFKVPLHGSFFASILLIIPFFLAIIGGGIIISFFSRSQVESIQISMLVAYPTFLLTGYTWPAVAIPNSLNALGKLFPLSYTAVNLRDIALKGLTFTHIKGDFLLLSLLALVYLAIGINLYKRYGSRVRL